MRFLAVDIGETTGWAIFEGAEAADGGQDPLWQFVATLRDGLRFELEPFRALDAIVIEDFVVYGWKCAELAGSRLDTVRGIGAVKVIANWFGVPFHLQAAKIKDLSEALGAEDQFVTPLHENRHQNDAVRHGVVFEAMQRGAIPEAAYRRVAHPQGKADE